MVSSRANFTFTSKGSAVRLEQLGQRGGYFGLVQVITYSYLFLHTNCRWSVDIHLVFPKHDINLQDGLGNYTTEQRK